MFDDVTKSVRVLSAAAVERANSGHPGMPLGMADVGVVLYKNFLKVSNKHPDWINRDRFVLSAGHGSMLLYSLLHFNGFDISLDEIKNFRQLGSKTAGHPEKDFEIGIDTTTGPLGQGFANGVGLAVAERYLASVFGEDVVDHHIYGIVSDGDLMEGISTEAAELAGLWELGKLIYFFGNQILSGLLREWGIVSMDPIPRWPHGKPHGEAAVRPRGLTQPHRESKPPRASPCITAASPGGLGEASCWGCAASPKRICP